MIARPEIYKVVGGRRFVPAVRHTNSSRKLAAGLTLILTLIVALVAKRPVGAQTIWGAEAAGID